MFPFNFEWANDAAHFIFMGAFYSAIIALALFVGFCAAKAFLQSLFEDEEIHDDH